MIGVVFSEHNGGFPLVIALIEGLACARIGERSFCFKVYVASSWLIDDLAVSTFLLDITYLGFELTDD